MALVIVGAKYSGLFESVTVVSRSSPAVPDDAVDKVSSALIDPLVVVKTTSSFVLDSALVVETASPVDLDPSVVEDTIF
jgi:hypothetical protein